MPQTCCAHPKLVWGARRVAEHEYADVLLCGGCGTVHITETWLAPILAPGTGRCLHCGALLEPDTVKGDEPTPGDFRCEACGMTDDDALELHRELANGLTREGSFLAGANEALDQGRQIRALKLATAAMRDDPSSAEARAIRLQTLQSIGYGESAAVEALRWAQEEDAPDVAWSITADLERSIGNLDGALRAMQRLLRRVPGDTELWLEYAQLLLQKDQRATALDAAQHALSDPATQADALAVIAEAAQRCVDAGQADHTRRALQIAGDRSTTHVPLVWVRAQLAAREGKMEDALQWLQRTLDLDPTHEAARAALDRLKPAEKSRWRFW